MKNFTTTLVILLATICSLQMNAQIAINEINSTTNTVELKNIGSFTIDISTYQLCSFPVYDQLSSMTLVSGVLNMAPGDITVVSGHSMGATDDELGLYLNSSFSSSSSILDYVEWGSTGHTRSTVAQGAGIWEAGDFIAAPGMGETMAWTGVDDSPSSWVSDASPTFGEENFGGDCDVDGGVIQTSGDTIVCVNDGVLDEIEFSIVEAFGTNMDWIVTTEDLEILEITSSGMMEFDSSEEGVCKIWHISYEDDITGLTVGENLADLGGCFELSEDGQVFKWEVDGGEVQTSDGETSVMIVVSDGIEDIIAFANDSESAADYIYIVTNQDDNVLFTTTDESDFESADVGVCHVYGLSYVGELTAVDGDPITDVFAEKCFQLSSNFITITKDLFDGVESLENNQIQLYLSPINSVLNITGVQEVNVISIYNLTGQLILDQKIQLGKSTVDVSGISNGVYVVVLESKNSKSTFRIAKTN